MSPVGTGAETLNFLPEQDFDIAPELFNELTVRNVSTPVVRAQPGMGQPLQFELPRVGIMSKLLVFFNGSFDVAAGETADTGHDFPYGWLRRLVLSANGQNDLYSLSGPDLHVLRSIRYPAYDEAVDDHPGTTGGGDTLAAGTHELSLTWEVPVAMDDVTLVGSLFAQSAATTLQLRLEQAAADEVFSDGDEHIENVTGTWQVQVVHYDIPFGPEGQLIVPDISRLHAVNAVETSITNVGENRLELIRGAGQLARLFVSVERDTNARLSALPGTADADLLSAIRLEYGGNKRPFVYNPAWTLLAQNNHHYGGPPPFDRVVFDFVKEHPVRDALILQGVTELAVVPDVGGDVTLTNGAVRLVQETLF